MLSGSFTNAETVLLVTFQDPVHFAITLSVSTSHNLTVPSPLPLATVLPSGDNGIVITASSSPSSFQPLPICAPHSRSHSRSEPSSKHVITDDALSVGKHNIS